MNIFYFLAIQVQTLLPDGLVKQDGSVPSLVEVFDYVSSGFVAILATAAVLSMLYGAYLYVVSSGNEELQTRAKTFLRYPILGLVVAAFAFVIVRLIVQIMLGE
jgi:hypothetical protein